MEAMEAMEDTAGMAVMEGTVHLVDMGRRTRSL